MTEGRAADSARRLFAGIFLVAFSTLMFEVSLIRVLSYTIWHHFGYVTISAALLGFGASGSVLAVRPEIGRGNLRATLATGSLLSGLAGLGMLLMVSAVPLHPMSIFSSPREAGVLLLYQVGAAVPFFFAGLVISLVLREAATRVDRLYFWDLVGAALGAGAAVAVMNWLAPPGAVVVASAAAVVAGLVFATTPTARAAAAVIAIGMLAFAPFARDLEFTVALSKHLVPGSHEEVEKLAAELEPIPELTRWTALFRTDVYEGTHPLFTVGRAGCKHWGVSLSAPEDCELPRYHINHDATAGTGIYDLTDGPRLDYLGWSLLQLPYLIANPDPRVLVIGVGGGLDIVSAVQHGASRVTGVELDQAAIDTISDRLPATNGFFQRPEIELVVSEGRHFVQSARKRFDLIQLTGVDTLSAEFSGSYVLAENYLYTVEAIQDYLDHLEPGGILSFAMAPVAAQRMASVARRALRDRGVADPSRHIAVIGSPLIYTGVLIGLDPLSPEAVSRLAGKADELGFPLLHLPGKPPSPPYGDLVRLAGPARQAALERLPYDVSAIYDDQPFFFSFFRWSDLLSQEVQNPSNSSALGQIILGVLVVSLTTLGAIFVLGPLFFLRSRGVLATGRDGFGILTYFLALGLGFMFFEISLIQRFVLFLGYPTYSLGVTLASLLFFLGCGSFVSRRFVGHESRVLPLAVLVVALLVGGYMTGLPWIQNVLLPAPLAWRIVATIALLAPLGLVLGIFFPLGIRRAQAVHPDLVPWAWGINGCASVTGGVLTVVLATEFGFTGVWMLSVLVYAAGVAALLSSPSIRDAAGPAE